MTQKIKLLTQPHCSMCIQVKNQLERYNYPTDNIEVVDCSTGEGESIAKEYGIRSVPVVVLADGTMLHNYAAIMSWLRNVRSN